MEEKVYGRYLGTHSQRQGHLGEFRMDRTKLSCAMWDREGKGEGREGREDPGAAARGPKVQKGTGNQNV